MAGLCQTRFPYRFLLALAQSLFPGMPGSPIIGFGGGGEDTD